MNVLFYYLLLKRRLLLLGLFEEQGLQRASLPCNDRSMTQELRDSLEENFICCSREVTPDLRNRTKTCPCTCICNFSFVFMSVLDLVLDDVIGLKQQHAEQRHGFPEDVVVVDIHQVEDDLHESVLRVEVLQLC